MSYIAKAIRTESIDGAKDRLGECISDFSRLKEVLNTITTEIDALKKFIYYGKPSIYVANDRLNLKLDVSDEQLRLLHSGLGMLTEAEEFLSPVVSSILNNQDLDLVNLKEELGDSMWYTAIACDVLGTTFEIEQERNITKLQQRYPEKFDSDKAINRDLEAERTILEQDNRVIKSLEVINDVMNLQYIIAIVTTENEEIVLTSKDASLRNVKPENFIGLTISTAKWNLKL